jgi:hypothetical protein
VTKLDGGGSALAYSTFLGGTSNEEAHAIAGGQHGRGLRGGRDRFL